MLAHALCPGAAVWWVAHPVHTTSHHVPALPHEWFRLICLHTCHVLGQPQDSERIDFCTLAVSQSHQVMSRSLQFSIMLCPKSPNCQPRLTCWHTYRFPTPPRVGMSIPAVFQQHHVLVQAPLSTSLPSHNPMKLWANPHIREFYVSVPLCCSAFDNHVLF